MFSQYFSFWSSKCATLDRCPTGRTFFCQLFHLHLIGVGEIIWRKFLGNGKVSVWASAKVRDSRATRRGRLSIAEDILRKSTDFLRRITVPSAACGGQYIGGQGLGHTRQHGPPKCQSISGTRGTARNVFNALKLLAHWQKDGDSPVRMIVPDLLEKSRRKMREQRLGIWW